MPLIAKFSIFVALCAALTTTAFANEKGSPEAVLAEAHGIADWPDVEAIEFTFHVDRKAPINRQWLWEVHAAKVTRTIGDQRATIDLSSLESEEDIAVHRQFINDSFWLIFPFKIVWSDTIVTDHGMTDVTISGETRKAKKLTALWPSEGGYTPGDAYDLYIGKDHQILAWDFRKGNQTEGRFFEWKDEQMLGPIRVSATRRKEGAEKPIISLKDLRIQLKGTDTWIEAETR
ncbi:MAG: hypothetical protein AAGC73_09975 [Verrucomicrobiota bacterium]